MMHDDPLNSRVHTYRNATSSREDGQATLARVQLAMATRQRRSRVYKGAILGLLSVLVSGAGFAGLYRLANPTRSEETPTWAGGRPPPQPVVQPSDLARQELAPGSGGDVGSPQGPKEEPKLALGTRTQEHVYERAHRLHFEGNRGEPALRAWDTYLKRFPRGHYAPEARFNRAICLMELERYAEAEEALRPIASGSTYHAPSARRLLEKIATAALAP